METLIKVLFSPTAFAVGFLWPLTAQVLILVGAAATWQTWLVAALVVAPFAAMAQFRGSWIWFRS